VILLLALMAAQGISLDKTGTLEELVEAFRAAGGGNAHLDPACREAAGDRELVLKDVKPASALRWIAWLWHLDLSDQDGVPVLRMGPSGRTLVRREYDLRSIPNMPGDRVGPKLALPEGSGPGLRLDVDETEFTGDNFDVHIQDLLKENAAPGTWEGDALMEHAVESKLIVHHTPAAHAEVAWYLDALCAFGPLPVTISAEFREAVDAAPSRVLAPEELEAAAEAFRQGKRLRAAGVDTQRVHAFASGKTKGVVGYVKGEPILETWVSDAAVLDVRPTLKEGGRRIALELRLALGQTRALEPARTKGGPLPLQQRSALRLGTTVVVPNGGGALLNLPGRVACLVRASAPSAPRAPARLSPAPPVDEALLARLAALPPADLDLDEGNVRDLAAWLRRVSGLNVVVAPGAGEKAVTVHAKAVAPRTILSLALDPHQLAVSARDEAIVLGESARRLVRAAIIETRDVADSVLDFPALPEGPKAAFTGVDIANVLKNTVHKPRWEEAEGKSIMYIDGLLLIRNTSDVLKDCAAFVEERRRQVPRQVRIQADMVDVTTEAVEKLDLSDPASLPKLLAGTVHERLSWISQEEQKTSLAWSRGVDHIGDYDGEDPIRRGTSLESWIEVRPRILKDALRLECAYEDPRLLELKEEKIRELPARMPVVSRASTASTTLLPEGKLAVFRWSLSPGQERLLVLRADVLTK
jgi:hypothetical protein